MLNPIDFKGFIAGWLLLLGALISIYWALYYYKKVPGPWKSLARRTLISLLLFGLGSVSAIIDSLTPPRPLWFLMVIFYTLSYIAILSTIFLSLRAAATSIEKPGGGVKERSTASKTPERNETREKELPLHSGYSIRKEPSPPQLFYLLKKVSKGGLIVVSRKSREEWIEKFGVHPDEFLWLSRADVENSIDPSNSTLSRGGRFSSSWSSVDQSLCTLMDWSI
ncbi:hypothetical protein [Thermococcus peptonophilus]|uniref:hypothetical protein n=1 Tax=Thermococcus peptonophilus TaxID=53952 RepID=UPI0006CF5684